MLSFMKSHTTLVLSSRLRLSSCVWRKCSASLHTADCGSRGCMTDFSKISVTWFIVPCMPWRTVAFEISAAFLAEVLHGCLSFPVDRFFPACSEVVTSEVAVGSLDSNEMPVVSLQRAENFHLPSDETDRVGIWSVSTSIIMVSISLMLNLFGAG